MGMRRIDPALIEGRNFLQLERLGCAAQDLQLAWIQLDAGGHVSGKSSYGHEPHGSSQSRFVQHKWA